MKSMKMCLFQILGCILNQPEAEHRCEYLFIIQTQQTKVSFCAPFFFPYNALNIFFVMASDFV